jgi:hypothetical protein
MSEIESIIKYEREGTLLDFKREQYRKEKYKDLIKDIMAMANATREGKRFIVTGVKDLPSGDKEYFPIPKEEFVDQATYQQVLRENVEPSIEFSYYPVEVEGNTVGVFEIDNCNNPPYMMKKDYNGLNKGDCYVRKGSQQEKMTRRDLDEILAFKSKFQFHGKIAVGFNRNLDKKLAVEAPRDFVLPSQEAKQEIEAILEERKFKGKWGLNHIERLGLATTFRTPFQPVPYKERETETLEKNLEEVQETYYEEDYYLIGEKLSEKVNLILRNDGDKYLEDVSIELKIPYEAVLVMTEIHKKPTSDILYAISTPDFSSLHYPKVDLVCDYFIVTETIGDLKHKQSTEAFEEELRVFFYSNGSNQVITCPYTIYAKNLPNPIVGELEIEVK